MNFNNEKAELIWGWCVSVDDHPYKAFYDLDKALQYTKEKMISNTDSKISVESIAMEDLND